VIKQNKQLWKISSKLKIKIFIPTMHLLKKTDAVAVELAHASAKTTKRAHVAEIVAVNKRLKSLVITPPNCNNFICS